MQHRGLPEEAGRTGQRASRFAIPSNALDAHVRRGCRSIPQHEHLRYVHVRAESRIKDEFTHTHMEDGSK